MATSQHPVKSGRLEIWHAASLALPAFFVSAVATSDFQSAIMSNGVQNVDQEVELVRSLWYSFTTITPPMESLQAFQRAFAAQVVARYL